MPATATRSLVSIRHRSHGSADRIRWLVIPRSTAAAPIAATATPYSTSSKNAIRSSPPTTKADADATSNVRIRDPVAGEGVIERVSRIVLTSTGTLCRRAGRNLGHQSRPLRDSHEGPVGAGTEGLRQRRSPEGRWLRRGRGEDDEAHEEGSDRHAADRGRGGPVHRLPGLG